MDDRNAIHRLEQSLKGATAVLVVGAGSSTSAGYPTWPRLIAALRAAVAPGIDFGVVTDLTQQADMIRKAAVAAGELDRYHRFLEQEFGPRGQDVPVNDMHVTLAQMRFAGIVTTNFDRVVETAVEESRRRSSGQTSCRSLDLCDERLYPVFGFMRDLRRNTEVRSVLHLHGFYTHPNRLILTGTDYAEHYGNTSVDITSAGPPSIPLDTIHRKVLWTLFVTYELLFVGFSMTDPAFRMMLDVVQRDFQLGDEPVHVAIMPRRDGADEQAVRQRLRGTGVEPIFYDVLISGGREDHSALQNLVVDLGRRLGVREPRTRLHDLAERLLNL